MIDRTGIRYGRLVAKEYLGGRKWRCLCDCGNEVDVYGCHLTCGHTRSCGCLNLLHGETKTRLHSVWNEMIQRCENPNSQKYQLYGGRGIRVCNEWHEFIVFRDWALAHGYDAAAAYGVCTIDRKDVDGDYTPENCRWVSSKLQSNNRRTNHYIEIDGVSKTITEWCREAKIDPSLFRYRKRCGMNDKDALFSPVRRSDKSG